MKSIKPRGLLINKKKFQLIGPKGEKSKKINLKQKSNKPLYELSKLAIEKGLSAPEWIHNGDFNAVYGAKGQVAASHHKFIELLKLNRTKNKSVLIIGPAIGYEVKYVKEWVKRTKVDTFDIIDAIDPDYKKEINNQFIFKGGIENYENKDLIGKYDGIKATLSAGWHTEYPARNIIKIATMLKPNGVAVIMTRKLEAKDLKKIFKTLQLTKLFDIERNGFDFIIKRK